MSNFRHMRQTYDVFVGNLPSNVNKKHLTQKFSAFGEILHVFYKTDRSTTINYGIFKYLCEPDAQRAVQECHNQEWEGIVLTVDHDRKNRNIKKEWHGLKTQKPEYPIKNWNPNVINDTANKMYQMPQNFLGNSPNDVAKTTYTSQYKPSNQQQIELMCTNVESVTTFYGNRYSKINEVTDIQSNLQHQCATLSYNTDVPVNGEVYASQYKDQIWYRCLVLENIIPSKPGMCTVNYIDFGNSEDVHYEKLVKLPKSMKAPPPLAVKCVLKDLEICPDKKVEGLKFCQEMLYGQRVFVESSSPLGPVIPVTRCTCNDINIFEQLVKEGLVVSTAVRPQLDPFSTLQSELKSLMVDQPINPNHQTAHIAASEYGAVIPSPIVIHNNAAVKPFDNERHTHGNRAPYNEPFYSNTSPKPMDAGLQFKFANPMPFPSNSSISSSGSDIMNKLGFSNASQQRPVKAFSAVAFPPQYSRPTTTNNKPIKKNSGFEPRDKNAISPNKIQILQRTSNEVSASKDILRLTSERDALKKQLTEQYEHVKELRSEISGLQKELEHNSINRKIDNIICSLKLVNHIRHLVSSSSVQNLIESTLGRLKTEFKNLNDAKIKRGELESVSISHAQSLEKIKACTNKTDLPSLVEEKNKLSEVLFTALKQYLDHYEKELQQTTIFIKDITEDLQRNSNMYADIPLTKVPNTIDELITGYEDVWKEKQDSVNSIKQDTNEKHRNFVSLFSELQKKFSLLEASDLQSSCTENGQASNAAGEEDVMFSAKFDDALSQLKDSLSKEIAAYALNNEGKSGTSIIQLLLSTINSLEKEVQNNSTFYAKYSSIYKELSITSNVESTISELSITKNKMKSVKSKLRHKLADKKDIEENEEDNSDALTKLDTEISSLQYELHSLFLDEDRLKKNLAVAYESNYPEINLEYPELNLLKYSQYYCLVKQSWEPEHFTLRKLQNRLGIEHESMLLNESVTIKEFVLESDDKINEFIASVKQWNSVKSNFLVNIRALFLKNERIMYALIPCVGYPIINTSFDECKGRLLLYKVLQALYDLHSSNLTHGALNPHAVLCNDENIVLDFFFDIKYKTGLSKFKNLSFHTPNETKTQSSDMYSFGCLILWVLFPSLPDFNDFQTSGVLEFQSLLRKVLSDKEQDILHALLHDNPDCRPTVKQLLENNFLRNFSESPSFSVPENASDADMSQKNTLSKNSTEDNVPQSQHFSSALTITEFSTVPLSTPDEDSSSQEDDAQHDILGSLYALREPLGATIGSLKVCHSQPEEALTSTIENIAVTESDNQTNSGELDFECDIVNLNSLQKSLGEAMGIDVRNDPSSNVFSETSEDSQLEMNNMVIPELESIHNEASKRSGEFPTASTSPAEQNMECDLAKGCPPQDVCDSKRDIVSPEENAGAPLKKEVFISDMNEYLVTDEEVHMLDYVSNNPTPENRSRASSDC